MEIISNIEKIIYLRNCEEWIMYVTSVFTSLGANVEKVKVGGEVLWGAYRLSYSLENEREVNSMIRVVEIADRGRIITQNDVDEIALTQLQ